MGEGIKLIIDIPDNDYRHIKEYYEKNDIVEATYSYIYHGIPLPKGHGRLIDVDDLDITTITTDDYSGNEVLDVILKEDLDDAPTIIEADKAESEDIKNE